jgi:hypothetical protein
MMSYTQEEQDVINRAEEYVWCVDPSILELGGHACAATAEMGLEQYLVGLGYTIHLGEWLHAESGPCVTVYSPTEQVAVEPYSRKLSALACAVVAVIESKGE